jgi:hypothetical protein
MVNSPWTVALAIAFALAVVYTVIGHLVFSMIIRRRGVPIRWTFANVPFYAEALYFRHRPSIRTKGLDVMAVTLPASFVGAFLLALLLFPQMR